jgi:hypothetical protein
MCRRAGHAFVDMGAKLVSAQPFSTAHPAGTRPWLVNPEEIKMRLKRVLKPVIQVCRGPLQKHSLKWVKASALLGACFLSIGLERSGWVGWSAQSLSLRLDHYQHSKQ